jgi:FkbM family methyltransferase
MIENLSKIVIANGGSIHPLVINKELTNGYGLCNPSILINNDGKLLVNLRNTRYVLHHSEFYKKFQSAWSGPLQYLNPDNDITLTTYNFLCELNYDTLDITSVSKINTSKLDVKPLWEFIGLEDARLVNWDDKLLMTGVRRDTTTNGEGRMEISEIISNIEVSRSRIDIPKSSEYLYCEKNWMPILDMPYHYVKWANPLEIIKVDPETNQSEIVISKPVSDKASMNLRGGSQVLSFGDYYIALVHETFFPYNPQNNKDATYTHRILVWNKEWDLVSTSQSFNFMGGSIEFSCGMAIKGDDILISFGFQDNAAYILKLPITFFKKLSRIDNAFSDFDWGEINDSKWFKDTLEEELVLTSSYEKLYKVTKGDIIVDIGASSGPFTHSILNKEPKHVYCLEPQKNLYKTLSLNFKSNNNVTCINKGISDVDGNAVFNGLYESDGYQTGSAPTLADSIKFKTLIDDNDIKEIDLLKIDCEGGEYDVFNAENKDWILNNVRNIAGEFHLGTPELKAKFRVFRDNYLHNFIKYEVVSMDYIDIKWDLFNDHFIEYYSEVMIYANNKIVKSIDKPIELVKSKPTPQYWRTTKYPTLEFTTSIPPKGCVIDCAFCPQRTLTKVYDGVKMMTLDNFKLIIDKLPKEIRVTFSGFVEPWLNPNATDMLLYAHSKGHPISVFTTGIGMTVEDIRRIKNIQFADGPNGGFCLHLPDEERIAKHPMSKRYFEVLEYIKEVQYEIKGFYLMSMGEVKKDIQHLFPTANTPDMWSRAGNLLGEAIMKPELDKIKHRFKHMNHGDKKMTCGCDEKLYHNVVLPNGDVSLCCMDYGLEQILGNLYTDNYDDIMPKPFSCFALCQKCENGVKPE